MFVFETLFNLVWKGEEKTFSGLDNFFFLGGNFLAGSNFSIKIEVKTKNLLKTSALNWISSIFFRYSDNFYLSYF